MQCLPKCQLDGQSGSSQRQVTYPVGVSFSRLCVNHFLLAAAAPRPGRTKVQSECVAARSEETVLNTNLPVTVFMRLLQSGDSSDSLVFCTFLSWPHNAHVLRTAIGKVGTEVGGDLNVPFLGQAGVFSIALPTDPRGNLGLHFSLHGGLSISPFSPPERATPETTAPSLCFFQKNSLVFQGVEF